MCRSGERVGVAVSGGADSVALLWCLVETAPELGIKLAVAHFNHCLRGGESDADERFVADLARSLDLPFYSECADIHTISKRESRNLEETARLERYRFLEALVEKGTVDRIATGHTRSDQAETVLFRLMRGTGEQGLRGIRPVLDTGIVRPLIDIPRQETRAYLESRGKSWREDSSNQDLRFSRNRIRSELLPTLERDWNPRIEEALARTASLAQEDEDYWREAVSQAAEASLVPSDPAVLIRTDEFAKLHPSISRRLLRSAIDQISGASMSYQHIESLRVLASQTAGSDRLSLPGMTAQRSFDWVRLTPASGSSTGPGDVDKQIVPPASLITPGGHTRVHAELCRAPPTDWGYNDSNWACVDWNRFGGSARLRNWRPGDRFRPDARKRPCLVKRLFQQARVPEWERRRWPVVVDGSDNLAWLRGFGASADWKMEGSSGDALAIRETDLEGREITSIKSWAQGVYKR